MTSHDSVVKVASAVNRNSMSPYSKSMITEFEFSSDAFRLSLISDSGGLRTLTDTESSRFMVSPVCAMDLPSARLSSVLHNSS